MPGSLLSFGWFTGGCFTLHCFFPLSGINARRVTVRPKVRRVLGQSPAWWERGVFLEHRPHFTRISDVGVQQHPKNHQHIINNWTGQELFKTRDTSNYSWMLPQLCVNSKEFRQAEIRQMLLCACTAAGFRARMISNGWNTASSKHNLACKERVLQSSSWRGMATESLSSRQTRRVIGTQGGRRTR